MQLKPGERVWAPADNPGLLVILKGDEKPPASPQEMLRLQTNRVNRLMQEAREAKELGYAENLLRDLLPWDAQQVMVPLTDKGAAIKLVMAAFPLTQSGSGPRMWLQEIRDFNPASPEASPEEMPDLEDETLDSFLGGLL